MKGKSVMTHKEYGQRKEMIYKQAVKCIRKLDREFAVSGCMTETGDIIGDCFGRIKVKKVVALHGGGNDYPCVKYYGPVLKKDGKPRKDKRQRWIYSYI